MIQKQNNTIKNNTTGIDFGGGGYGPRVHSAFLRNNIIDNNNKLRGTNLYMIKVEKEDKELFEAEDYSRDRMEDWE